jgi:UDP-N-acetylmuramoyl-tripeptide--D-alanyl-D-alanine ligase
MRIWKTEIYFMAQSKILSKTYKAIFPFADFLYILQQEDYSTQRYLKWLPRFFWRRNFQVRDHLYYTQRATITLFFIVAVWLCSLGAILIYLGNILFDIIVILIWLVGIPIAVLIGNAMLSPVYVVARRRVLQRAGEKVKRQKNLRVISVAGSFGKTTTKNFIHQLVRQNYRTQMIPGNINTPLGIANWIMRDLRVGTELLIVEIDGYNKDEVADSSRMVPADIAIITNIGDQHLERFGDRENLAAALGEVFHFAKPNGVLIANPETAQILKKMSYRITITDENTLGVLGDLRNKLGSISISSREDLTFAIKAAKQLNIPDDFIIHSCQNLEVPDRRQKITTMYGYDCIDDSYNISFTTAQAGIAAAHRFAETTHKKLLAVTAGIPELGPNDQDKNRILGELLAQTADHVIILNSMFAAEIATGIHDEEKRSTCLDLKTFLEVAHTKFPPEQWVLFMEPELTDLYY